jgi:predicted nucleic acid-binding protein
MTFDDLPAGEAVFLDANVFVYAYSAHPQFGVPGRELLDRIDRGELSGFTSSHVLTEAAHRLMTLEACNTFGWPYAGIARCLRQHVVEVQQLTQYQQAIDEVLASSIRVLGIVPALVSAGIAVSRRTGLLSNDALLVAVMQEHGLTHLASHDADFDRVPGLTRYAPA